MEDRNDIPEDFEIVVKVMREVFDNAVKFQVDDYAVCVTVPEEPDLMEKIYKINEKLKKAGTGWIIDYLHIEPAIEVDIVDNTIKVYVRMTFEFA